MAIDPGKQGRLTRDTPGNTGLVFIVSSLFTYRDAGRPSDVRAADQFSRVLADLHRVAKPMTCDHGRERLTGVPGTPHRFLDSPSRRCVGFGDTKLRKSHETRPRTPPIFLGEVIRFSYRTRGGDERGVSRIQPDYERIDWAGVFPLPAPGAPVHSQGRKPSLYYTSLALVPGALGCLTRPGLAGTDSETASALAPGPNVFHAHARSDIRCIPSQSVCGPGGS